MAALQVLDNAGRGRSNRWDDHGKQSPRVHDRASRDEGQAGGTVPENFDESTGSAPIQPMTPVHSPWPLFSDDLDFAQKLDARSTQPLPDDL